MSIRVSVLSMGEEIATRVFPSKDDDRALEWLEEQVAQGDMFNPIEAVMYWNGREVHREGSK